ncbi:complement receptor type 2-like [Dreissena polymorpha]|uniref:complement receptor type 2-like n=1 Tax=Dreissena polymorpha TaxID=45954 RepID=UPI0022646605|nr:complement receptor type 2-like [Dreissena polymorpha]
MAFCECFGIKMLTLLCICSVLFFSVKLTESAAFKSVDEERQCQSVATLTNGVIIGDVRNNNVSYKCDHGFFSNVPNLQQILFSCKYIQELGSVAWKGQGIEVKGKQGLQALYFNAVKCSPGCPQPDYSKFPENLMVNSISSAKLIIVNSTGLPIEDPTYFLSGDTIAWTCEEGYVHTGLPGNETNQEFDNYNMYNEYETSKDESVAPAKALTCGDDGYWNSGDDEDLGFCKEITCDARDYQNIRNGMVANYKHVYEFNETMTLDCDHGFRPYKNHEYLHCLDEESFEDEYFGCEAITCPRPPEPLHGGLERTQLYYYPNQTAEFYCDPGYVMKGARTWQCLASGIWDKPCVRCARADNHCQPPCIPFGAHVINPPRRIDIGTTMEFACDEQMNGRPTNRTCLLSKQWSGEQIDCTGRSLFMSDMNDVIRIATVIKRTQDSANTAANAYDDSYVISIAFETGVDVYFLMDVSKSIDERQFEQMKKCINGVVENLGLNNTQDSTRVGVYLFATNVKATFTPRDRLSASEMIAALDKTSLRDSRVDTGLGTAISKALDYMQR